MSTQEGYFVLADISGYTSYMAGTELEHAQEIIHEIISNVIDHLVPPLELAEVEGDAVFAYVPVGWIGRGETLLEIVETVYLSFRNRRDSMKARTTCTCRACASIPTLELKFITHIGQYVLQEVAGKKKPIGSDINLAHRLLKNHTAEMTGWKAYALFSKQTLERLGIWPSNMHEGKESYEHFATIATANINLHSRYDALQQLRQVTLSTEECDDEVVLDIHAPPAVVWEWVNDPRRRNQTDPDQKVNWSVHLRPGGRTAAGATNHCDHGSGKTDEKILDWKPFEYFSATYEGGGLTLIMTWELKPTTVGTHLIWRGRIKNRMPRFLRRLLVKKLGKMAATLQKMKSSIESELTPPRSLQLTRS